MPIQSYRDLDAWRLGMDFVVEIYRLTSVLPQKERYGLSAQLRRAAVSIPSNVAEGHQQGTKSCAHFVSVALGSLAEAETQIEVASRLRYVSAPDLASVSELAVHLGRVLHGLRRSLQTRE